MHKTGFKRLMTLKNSKSVILLSFGLILLGFSSNVAALTNPSDGSIGLSGTVSAPAPTQGATITSPANGAVFTNLPVTVVGWCPANLLVKIFRNNVFSGSVMCSSNSYSIKIDLFSGRNDLIARVYDSLDQAGPDSNMVSVTFNDNSANPNIASRISLTSNYARRGADPKTELTWPIIISGGTPPYAISVDWGDGSSSDLYTATIPGEFTIKHTYGQSGSFDMLVKASDQNRSVAYLQLVAISNGKVTQASVAAASANKTKTTSSVVSWALIVIFLLFIVLAFWLGRRSEDSSIKKRITKGEHPFGM
ncbi:MAG TPA: hypothetical protein VMR51_00080 [Patescibacteria group bacterium]|nr:hypothetical protein [Patescibacteria group bacterium]